MSNPHPPYRGEDSMVHHVIAVPQKTLQSVTKAVLCLQNVVHAPGMSVVNV